MKSILVLLFIALASSAWAEDSAGTIKSNGVAQLEKVSDFLLFSSSKKIDIRIPSIVNAGETIPIQYIESGKETTGRFTVVDIAIRGNLCWLHSKTNALGDISLGNTIYVQPCVKIR